MEWGILSPFFLSLSLPWTPVSRTILEKTRDIIPSSTSPTVIGYFSLQARVSREGWSFNSLEKQTTTQLPFPVPIFSPRLCVCVERDASPSIVVTHDKHNKCIFWSLFHFRLSSICWVMEKILEEVDRQKKTQLNRRRKGKWHHNEGDLGIEKKESEVSHAFPLSRKETE